MFSIKTAKQPYVVKQLQECDQKHKNSVRQIRIRVCFFSFRFQGEDIGQNQG